jgi:hypothetical protein
MDIESCAKGLIDVIKDKELQHRLVESTRMKDYTNTDEIKKIYQLVEE